MILKPDIVVCNPNASSDRGKAVFLHFEVMNPATLESTGEAHNIAMPHADAKKLFGLLGAMSEQYGWLEVAAPDVLHVPPANNPPANQARK